MLYGEEEQMENENDNRNKNNGKMPKNMQTIIILVISGLLMLMLISFMNTWIQGATNREISYDDFIEMLEKGKVSSVSIQSDRIIIEPKEQVNAFTNITFYTGIAEDRTTISNRCQEAGV